MSDAQNDSNVVHGQTNYRCQLVATLCRKDVTTYGMYRQFLSWYLGKQLLEQVEMVHGDYDLVIRSRIDVVLWSPLLLPSPLEQTIYVPAIEGTQMYPLIDACTATISWPWGRVC